MVNIFKGDFGFETLEVISEYGSVVITNFRNDLDKITDIGYVSISASSGLGGSAYIRNVKDGENHIERIIKTVWLSDEEKEECISFINRICE